MRTIIVATLFSALLCGCEGQLASPSSDNFLSPEDGSGGAAPEPGCGTGGSGGTTTTVTEASTSSTSTGGGLLCDPQIAFEESASCFMGYSGDGCCDMPPTDLAGHCEVMFGPKFSTPVFCEKEAGAPEINDITCKVMDFTMFPCVWGASQLYCCGITN